MRRPAPRSLLLLIVALLLGVAGTRSYADDRAEARAHYQAGVKAYGSGDYKAAIKEFSTAQQLVPADLNNYNLALCYDKLGDAQPAIQYYKEYLNKVPNADKRAEIEASISRLEAAVKSAEAKKAEEARKADEAKKAEEAKQAEAAKQADAAKAGPGAGAAVGATVGAGATVGGAAGGVSGGVSGGAAAGAGALPPPGPSVGVGTTGTPGTGQVVSTGDAQLDRVQGIDVNAIREQRMGAGTSGMDTRGGPAMGAGAAVGAGAGASAGAGAAPNGQPQPGAGAPPTNGTAAATTGPTPAGGLGPTDKPQPKEQPVYKKWWFWAVVAVSAYVVYEIATQSSTTQPGTRARELPLNSTHAVPDIGPTLWHF